MFPPKIYEMFTFDIFRPFLNIPTQQSAPEDQLLPDVEKSAKQLFDPQLRPTVQ
jgi:hypothetical protein